MLSESFELLVSSLSACADNFDNLFSAIPGAGAVLLAALIVFFAVKFFLFPLVGSGIRAGSSDKARKKGRGK